MIVCFKAKTKSYEGKVEEYFEFDDYEISAIIVQCLDEWASSSLIDETTATWYKIEVSDRFKE